MFANLNLKSEIETNSIQDILDQLQIIQSKYIHSLGISHNDVHPGNIMIRSHKSFLIGKLY